VIPVADIDARKDGLSLMPEGLTDPLTKQELIDLTRFLSELGKGAYAATPGKVVRRWQALQPTKELTTIVHRERLGAVTSAADLTWTPAYSLVSGDLPPEAWKAEGAGPAFVRCDLDVTAPGQIGLRVNTVAGLKLWVDGQPTELKENPTLALQRGVHTLVFQVDPAARGQTPLHVELREEPGSSGAAQPVGGT
jgi:hypothetical protein